MVDIFEGIVFLIAAVALFFAIEWRIEEKLDEDKIIAEYGEYTGVLYGKSSMKIYKNGRLYLSTCSRNPNIKTHDDLMSVVRGWADVDKSEEIVDAEFR